MDREKLMDRIAGSFYGLLVGDAFGCPVEGYPPKKIRKTFGRLTELEESRHWRWPRGLHSDDGQQAIMVCDSVLNSPENPGQVFAKLIVDMYRAGLKGFFKFGLHRGTGGNFRRTVKALARGRNWNEASTLTAGNGSSMRIAPLGLFFRENLEGLTRAVIDLARVTHLDIRGIAAASAVAYTVARALSWKEKAANLADEEMVKFVHEVEEQSSAILKRKLNMHDFSKALLLLFSSLDEPRQKVLKKIEDHANKTSLFHGGPTTGFVLSSVITSLYMFFSSENFEQALIDTVMLGGDTDTTGAMTGQLCGALYGLEKIPRRWLEALVAFNSLEDRIEALLERKTPCKPKRTVVEMEEQWMEQYFR
jgi:ADP-ribosyl-[dinitrogen reductase] hydrolase